MLSKYRWIIATVDLLTIFENTRVSGHAIANEMTGLMSRATTYRWINKAWKNGLLIRIDDKAGYHWEVSQDGYEFMEKFNELPI